jgi:hypothetical protein
VLLDLSRYTTNHSAELERLRASVRAILGESAGPAATSVDPA